MGKGRLHSLNEKAEKQNRTKHHVPSPVFEEGRQFQQKVESPPEIQVGRMNDYENENV